MKRLDASSSIGTLTGVPDSPPAGSVQYTFALSMTGGQLSQPGSLDLVIQARQQSVWVEVARYSTVNGVPWAGGKGQPAPSLTYTFPLDPTTRLPVQPAMLRGVVENGVNGIAAAWQEGDGTFA